MAFTPEDEFLALIKDPNVHNVAVVERIFDQLKPIKPEFLFGDWDAHLVDTGHPVSKTHLPDISNKGKTFHSLDNVYKVNRDTRKVTEWGCAILREVKFRGVISATMIYDDHPIIEQFRYVNEDIVAGVNWYKKFKEAGVFYFYMTIK